MRLFYVVLHLSPGTFLTCCGKRSGAGGWRVEAASWRGSGFGFGFGLRGYPRRGLRSVRADNKLRLRTRSISCKLQIVRRMRNVPMRCRHKRRQHVAAAATTHRKKRPKSLIDIFRSERCLNCSFDEFEKSKVYG